MEVYRDIKRDTVQMTGPVTPVMVGAADSIHSVLVALRHQDSAGSALVCEDGRVVGIFTERDAMRVLAGDGSLDAPVGQVMRPDPVCVGPETTVWNAISQMAEGGYRRLPMTNANGKALGIVTVPGIVHYLVEHFPASIYNLPPDPHKVMQEREGS